MIHSVIQYELQVGGSNEMRIDKSHTDCKTFFCFLGTALKMRASFGEFKFTHLLSPADGLIHFKL